MVGICIRAKRRQLILVCLVVIIQLLPTFTPGKSHSFRQRSRHRARPANVNAAIGRIQNKFTLATGDIKRVKKYETFFLLRLHSIITSFYFDVLINNVRNNDWLTAIAIYERISSESESFREFSSDSTIAEIFDGYSKFHAARAELCEEAMNAHVSSYLKSRLFLLGVKNVSVPPFVLGNEEAEFYDNWFLRLTSSLSELESVLGPQFSNLQSSVGVDPRSFYLSFESQFPFDFPLQESDSESAYLFETLIEGSTVGVFLSIQYRNDIIRLADELGKRILNPLVEVAVLWGKLGDKLGVRGFHDFYLSELLDCAEVRRKQTRESSYAEAVALHQQVQRELDAGNAIIIDLSNFGRRQIKSNNLTGEELKRATALLKGSDEYLSQRGSLVDHVRKLERFSINALRQARSGHLDVLDKGITKAVLDFIDRIARVKNTGKLRLFLPSGCNVGETPNGIQN